MKLKFIILIFYFIIYIKSYKILIYNPKFGHSHVNFIGRVADILVDAGHDVTVIVVDIDLKIKHPGSYKGKIYNIKGDDKAIQLLTNDTKLDTMWEASESVWAQFNMISNMVEGQYLSSISVFNDEDLEKFIKNQHFDLGISEIFNNYMFGLFKAWGINTYVSLSSFSLMEICYEKFGLHFPSSHLPTITNPYTDKMTYLQRFNNFISYIFTKIFFNNLYPKISLKEQFDNKYGSDFFDYEKVSGDSAFLFINSNPFFDLPGPKTPKMIEISGVGISEKVQLNDYWNKILSLRNNTILISFGSMAKSSVMPKAMKNGIVEMVKNLPEITFICKYETPEDNVIEKIDNLILSKWTPQSDLLYDDRLSLMITHGGLNTTTELAYSGTPSIAVPIFGDQLKNSRLLERSNIGIIVEKKYLANSDILIENIMSILNNNTYKNNAKKLSEILNNKPVSSKELLIKHVEFACQFGQLPMLDLGSREMNSIVYFNLDIIMPIISILILILYLPIIFIFKKMKKCYNNYKNQDQRLSYINYIYQKLPLSKS